MVSDDSNFAMVTWHYIGGTKVLIILESAHVQNIYNVVKDDIMNMDERTQLLKAVRKPFINDTVPKIKEIVEECGIENYQIEIPEFKIGRLPQSLTYNLVTAVFTIVLILDAPEDVVTLKMVLA